MNPEVLRELALGRELLAADDALERTENRDGWWLAKELDRQVQLI